MITITYEELRNPEFLAVCQRLFKSKMSLRAAKKANDILKKLQSEFEIQSEAFKELVKEHYVDEGGDQFRILEGEEHSKAADEFMNTQVEIQLPKLTLPDLFHMELSPYEMELIAPLLEPE